MQTRTDAFALGFNWLNPLGSWEATARLWEVSEQLTGISNRQAVMA